MENLYISNATIRNWTRLNANANGRLTTRANKTNSRKVFIPSELIFEDSTYNFILELIDLVKVNKWKAEDVLYTLIKNTIYKNGLGSNKNVKKFISEYDYLETYAGLMDISIPVNEYDIFGIIYQSFQSEGEKNIKGSYYTSLKVVYDMVGDISLLDKERFLDPCCGSGAFLLSINTRNPSNLWGIDNDPIAVMLAKANLILKYKEIDFEPNIYFSDFLDSSFFENEISLPEFRYIATNPPWGSVNKSVCSQEIRSGEAFSLFFVKSFGCLSNGGKMRFLLPEAVMNVKAHKDIRNFILNSCDLKKITVYDGLFTGVLTKFVCVDVEKNGLKSEKVFVKKREKIFCIEKKVFSKSENKIFSIVDNVDIEIINKIREKGELNLKESEWALGIVTGDNKNKLHSKSFIGGEPIYTGKEIRPFLIDSPKKYILFDRSQLQQVADDYYYRASEKLVYKFISRKLVFAYDNTGSLFLNSANILIPCIDGMSVKTVMAFLNSSIFQYMYIKLFNEVKILKGNLLELPFPRLVGDQDEVISGLVDNVLNNSENAICNLDRYINSVYSLSDDELKRIRNVVDGRDD